MPSAHGPRPRPPEAWISAWGEGLPPPRTMSRPWDPDSARGGCRGFAFPRPLEPSFLLPGPFILMSLSGVADNSRY